MEPHQSHTTAEKTWVDPWPEHPTEATPVGPIRALQPSLNKPSWTNCHEPSSMEHTVNSPEPLQKLRLLGGSRPNCYVIIPCAELASEPCRVLPKFIRRASTKCPAPSHRPTIPRSLISTLPRPILTLPAPSTLTSPSGAISPSPLRIAAIILIRAIPTCPGPRPCVHALSRIPH